MFYYLLAILGLSVIIAIHEIGHLITAKRAGMKVERFGIGMGPSIFCIERGGTQYCLCWIPIGGFCQIKGEEAENSDPDSFNAKPPFHKFLVAFSGPFANFLTAFLLLVFLFNVAGQQVDLKIGQIMENYPAYSAGLKEGDLLKGVNGNFVSTQEVIQAINENPGQSIMLNIERNGNSIVVPIVPVEEERDGSLVGLVGIVMAPLYERVAFFPSIQLSITTMGTFFRDLLVFVARVITGRVEEKVEVVGPLGIIGIAASSASSSWVTFLFFIAFLSLNLGMLNLFPIPPLDGGKIVFALWEGVTKKPVNKKFEIIVNMTGFLLLIGLILFVTFKDILGFF
jgi:regulator of sigma E protease